MKILFALALMSLVGCNTIKNTSSPKTKDALLNWIFAKEKAAYVDKKLLHINDIASLKLTMREYDQKKYGAMVNILSSPLSLKDSISLQKSIASQRDTLNVLTNGKKSLQERKPNDNYFEPYIRLSDPVYFPKENVFLVIYEYYCGSKCGQGSIRVYQKTNTDFTEIREVGTWMR